MTQEPIMDRSERLEVLVNMAQQRLQKEKPVKVLLPDENVDYKEHVLVFKGKSFLGEGGLAFCTPEGSITYTVTYFEFQGDSGTVLVPLPDHYQRRVHSPKPMSTAPIPQDFARVAECKNALDNYFGTERHPIRR